MTPLSQELHYKETIRMIVIRMLPYTNLQHHALFIWYKLRKLVKTTPLYRSETCLFNVLSAFAGEKIATRVHHFNKIKFVLCQG
jgi:hypothetical protein